MEMGDGLDASCSQMKARFAFIAARAEKRVCFLITTPFTFAA
jgi:hypothetical protein